MSEVEKYSVLVVDDSPEQIRYISEILQTEGCRIYAATSCAAAFKVLKKHLPNLIILDIVMPDMDGFDLCRILKEDKRTQDIPVIFATAYHDIDYLGQGFAVGGCDYLIKPFIREELLERVKVRIRLAKKRIQIQRAYAELDKFCYTVSHDIRAPLYVIKQLSELLQKEVAAGNKKEAEKISGMILEKSTQAVNMTDGLHRFSKVFYEDIGSESVDMNQVFEDVFEELCMLEKDREIRFEKGDLPEIMGDSVLLHLVIQNILSNAIKFTRKRKAAEITVDAKIENQYLCFIVTDNGIGFDEEYAEELFQIYHRLHTAQEYEGDGIGLATVKRIMLRHGGKVDIESKSGEGTTIRLWFPTEQKRNEDE